MNYNTLKVDGSGNVVLQDIQGSTINVSTFDAQDFWQEYKKLFFDKATFWIIGYFNTTTQKVEDAKDWKPFAETEEDEEDKNTTILNFLSDFCNTFEVNPHITLVEELKLSNPHEQMEAYFRYKRREVIVIIDAHCINNPQWSDIFQLFDDYYIGGCIVLGNYDNLYEDLPFKFLKIYRKNKGNIYKQPIHLKLKDVKLKEDLKEALATILGLHQIEKINTHSRNAKITF